MRVLFALGILLTVNATAQTAIIAHKSHSGNYSTFFVDPNSNFGEPPPRLVQVVRLSDTSAILVHDHMGYVNLDTIYNNRVFSNFELNIDSMKKNSWYDDVEYINYKESSDSLKMMKPGNRWQMEHMEIQEENNIPVEETTPKKKKSGIGLLIVFILVGGGLIGFKVFSQKSVVPNAA